MFDVTTGPKKDPKEIRLVKNTDWGKFDEILSNNPVLSNYSINTADDIDRHTANLNTAITEAFEQACPITYISSAIKKPPWLTPEIQQAQKAVRRKLLRVRKYKNPRARKELKDCNTEYNKLLDKTRRTAWRKFCQETETVKQSAKMNHILKNCDDPKVKLEAVYNSTGALTSSAKETLDVMADAHFKNNTSNNPQPPDTPYEIHPDLVGKIYEQDRMDRAIKTFDPYKAAGPDNLQPVLIQKAWKHIYPITRRIMIKNHELQHIPRPWRESRGIFLPKPGKADYCNPKSYRTITLSPVMLKLQEKIILWHLQHDLNMADTTSKKQYGFKKGCSTEAALHKVVHTIEKRITKKGYVLGVFLDIEGAFDNVSFKAISEAVHNTKADKATAQWIINMVTNRFITINHKTDSKRISIRRGCPQGGILSPFLWNLVVDDLLSFSAKDLPGYLQAFADDLVSLAEGNDLEVIWSRTQKTINTIEKWCQTKDLSISALKTQVVMFTWNKKWSIRPIRVGGHTTELSKTAKFLGITLDSKLTFTEHINNITKKATGNLMQCKRAVGPTWGMEPSTCKWLYYTVIRPILSYCSSIWVRALNNQTNATKLRRVQALGLRITSGALPSTPFSALNIITDTADIIHYLQGEAAKGFSRLDAYCTLGQEALNRGKNAKGTIQAHTTINRKFLDDLTIPKRMERDLTTPTLALNRNFTCIYPPNDTDDYRATLTNTIDNLDPTTITCYTDGSKTEIGNGAGFIITTNNNNDTIKEACLSLPPHSTVFQAELSAIKEACHQMNDMLDRHIIIWTDSLSSIQALSATTIRSKTTRSCFTSINNLGRNNNVELRWIAAHTGLWGNEKADQLAKLGTAEGTPIVCPIPQSYIKNLINQKVRKLDRVEWERNGHPHTKLTLGRQPQRIIGQLNNSYGRNRKMYRIATQLITGHCVLNKHLFTIHRAASKTCPDCNEQEETVSHLLGQCPAKSMDRHQYFGDYYMPISEIFKRIHITNIVSYANNTGRFDVVEQQDESGVT